MEQLTKNQAVATSQEAVQNQNEPQLRDENAHNDKSVHGVLNPTYQAGLRRDAVQPDIEAEIQTFFLISWFSLLLLQLLRHLFYRHLKLHRQRYILIV